MVVHKRDLPMVAYQVLLGTSDNAGTSFAVLILIGIEG